jgi:hypothetical protein
MKDQDESSRAGELSERGLGSAADETVTRAEGQGEVDEPDAPTAEEENAGMNTVLDAEPVVGVQDDESSQ